MHTRATLVTPPSWGKCIETLDLQRLVAIVEGSDDAIISKTLDGTITTWNAGAERMFGFTAKEMIGASIIRIIPDDLIDEEREILEKLKRGERINDFDTFRRRRSGERIAISLTVSPLHDAKGKVVGASKIARDVSRRKESENALQRSNEALQGAIEAAQQLRVEAENANRAKTEFLAVMSHEIRTPLNSIRGFIDLLTNSTLLTPQQHRYVTLVKTASAALMTVVNDILDFSKVEAGELELERLPFSLRTLVRDTAAIVAPAVDEKKLTMTVTIDQSLPEWITGDNGRLCQVLLNLLNNAVKFTDSGTINVQVRPQVTASKNGRIFFSVTDTGVGVPVEHQHRLFKQFSQADSSVTRRHGGTGLGLAICKRLVRLMDGEIGIVSDVGRGSTLWFTAYLPCAADPVAASAPESKEVCDTNNRQKARILVVDDIDTNLEIMEAYLGDVGYLVECASNGLDAIQMLSSTKFDLILMDIQMPIMDGVTATQRIRALPPPLRDISIIAMTGNVLPKQVQSFLAAGMNDHVGKPIDRLKLFNIVRRWLPTPASSKINAGQNLSAFDATSFDNFVLLVGAKKAKQIVDKFLAHLPDAFEASLVETQREAHGLINTAGVLGLTGFVAACQQIAEVAQQESESGDASMKGLQRERATALRILKTRLLPKLIAGADCNLQVAVSN